MNETIEEILEYMRYRFTAKHWIHISRGEWSALITRIREAHELETREIRDTADWIQRQYDALARTLKRYQSKEED